MLKINGLYEHFNTDELWILLEVSASNEDEGLFRSTIDGRSLFFDLAQMKSVYKDVEFDLEDMIEISPFVKFNANLIKGKFKYKDADGDYWIASDDGYMNCAQYARKAEDKPKVNIDGILYACTESQKNKHEYLDREIKGLQNLLMGLAE